MHNVAGKDGGGIYLSESQIEISGKCTIVLNNTAQNFRRGMFLESTSNIQIRVKDAPKKHFLRFIRNSAQRGGGVYVEDNDQPLCREGRGKELSKPCFLQTFILHKKTPFHLIVFELRSAADTGSDIFGGLLDRCADSIVTQSSASRHSGIECIQKNVQFDWANNSKVTDITDLYRHISSDPVRVCHCAKEGIDCNNIITQPQVFSKKGEGFTLSLIALDQVRRPVNAAIISSLTIGDGVIEGLGKGQERRTIGGHCTELEYNVYSVQSEVAMKVFADGPCGDQGISKQDTGITFLPCTCPTGLEIGPNVIRCSCECDRRLASFVSNCSQENGTIQVNSNVWIEYVSSTNITDYVIHACPFDYCVEKPANISLTDQDEQCAFNRTGTLCGECKQGLILVFASSQCQQCSNYYLFLLLSCQASQTAT